MSKPVSANKSMNVKWREIGAMSLNQMALAYNPLVDHMAILAAMLTLKDKLIKYVHMSYSEQVGLGDINETFMSDNGHYEHSNQMLLSYFAKRIMDDWDRVYSGNVAILFDIERPIEVRRDLHLNKEDWAETGVRAPDLEILWCQNDILMRWLPTYLSSGDALVIVNVKGVLVAKVFTRRE